MQQFVFGVFVKSDMGGAVLRTLLAVAMYCRHGCVNKARRSRHAGKRNILEKEETVPGQRSKHRFSCTKLYVTGFVIIA